jgi:hypothetical protein
MATKSSSKKSAPKKLAAKSKVAVKKTAPKKAKASLAKKAKPAVKADVKKKISDNKTVAKSTKKSTISPTKSNAKKVIKVVNNKLKKASAAKSKLAKPIKKDAKSASTVKPKQLKTVKKANPKSAAPKKATKIIPKAAVKKAAPIVKNKPSPKTAKEVKEIPLNDIQLKPVTKPILKKSITDAAASQRNMAIRAKYKKVEIEYPVHSAKHILFSYLSTSSGLSEWFADKVNEKGDIMVFEWDGAQQAAKVLSAREDHHIRFRWLDMPEAIYFEFRVETDEITGDLALIITDFCEDESSIDSTKNLWNSQIDKLFHVLGIH